MQRRVAKLATVYLLISLIGGHWFLLQTAGWVGMFARYSQAGDWQAAFEKTFDGDHPCGICKVVREGRQAESERQSLPLTVKLDPFTWLGPASEASPRGVTDASFAMWTAFLPQRSDCPPAPPPRVA